MLLRTNIDVFLNATPSLISVICFGLYVTMGYELTAAKAYMLISLFNLLLLPLRMIIMAFVAFQSAKVSVIRIDQFLKAEEKE